MTKATWKIGVDVGGTFTDVVALSPDGESTVFKVPSDPEHPAAALLQVLKRITKTHGSNLEGLEIVHGTTVATNALEERKGARTALITTRGFRDLLEIARQSRDEIYEIDVPSRQPPFVPRELCFEIGERLNVSGEVILPLQSNEISELIDRLKEAQVESIAVCLLHSYANPVHERVLGEALSAVFPHVSLSSEVNAEFREYERALTTVLNAYLMPVVGRFLSHLNEDLTGLEARLHLVQSNGGMMSATAVRKRPLNLVMSGPAAGAAAVCALSLDHESTRALALDMGGTTTDVCLVENGQGELMAQRTIAGQPFRLRSVAVESIGAGGGSQAWTDEVGALHVGPQSAGAHPGPACYGLGGIEPTLTDANLLLGYLNPDAILGGTIRLNCDKAEEAMGRLSEKLGMTVTETARGVVAIAEANVLGALRLVSIKRGRDMRDGVLVAYGGVGPVHAASLAKELEMKCVIVPSNSSVFSALGCMTSNLLYEAVRTHHVILDNLSAGDLKPVWEELIQSTQHLLTNEGHSEEEVQVRFSLDLRYRRQNYEIEIPLSGMNGWTTSEVRKTFDQRHQALYHYTTDEPIECVNMRVAAIVQTNTKIQFHPPSTGETPRELGNREVDFNGEKISTPILSRAALIAGETFDGPAIVEDEWSVTVLPPNHTLTLHEAGHLILEGKA